MRYYGYTATISNVVCSSSRHLRAPRHDVDVRLSRAFAYREKYKLTLGGEAFNILNRQQFTAYNTTAYTLSGTTGTYQATFGTPSAAGNTIYRERQIQFVGRFEF